MTGSGAVKDQKFSIIKGFPEDQREKVANLYWQAFSGKLALCLGPEVKGKIFIERVLNHTHAISALSAEGKVLGVAGYKTIKGALVGGNFSDIQAVYGWFGATWRAVLLSILDRDLIKSELLMDGIFVEQEARGMGIGTALLKSVASEAKTMGLKSVRLDVIDSNIRARNLYERSGFKPIDKVDVGIFASIFGFKTATTMSLSVE